MLRNQQPSSDSKPKELKAVVSQTLPSIRSAYKQAFLEAASKIESGEIKDQEQWTKFIADNAGAKQREALDRVYEAIDKLDLPASFAGKESEIAKINREIAGAW
jgi:thiamine biosynthesis lipoprotein ApbE